MKEKINILFSFAILAFSFKLLGGTYLSKSELKKVVHLTNKETKFRFTRQLIIDPQPFLPLVTNRVLQVPVPTNIAFFPGGGQPTDQCNREETLMEDGSCQNLLTPGNCGTQEEVLMDPQTNRGFCAPRICPPDRVFLPLTQLCHDPRDASVCPPGRELYYSAYGTAVCTCPDGTVEGDDDLDDDVCEPVLGTTLQCSPGMYEHESMPVNYNQPTYTKHVDSQASLSSSYSVDLSDYYKPQVFWFKDFNSPPQCLPDPCNGTNLKRGPNDLPYVPNEHGKCFQLGQTEEACPYGKIYILNLEKVRGECASLEDAGYNIFDLKVLEALKKMFGPTITENTGAPFKATYGNVNQTIYGISSSYPYVQQSSNTIQPISSYPTSPVSNIQSINNNQDNQNSINSFLNGFVSLPFDQTNNVGTQPSKQTHHQIVLGSNGFSSTKKTEILSAINLTNLLSSTHQGGKNFSAIFNYQTTRDPITHLNSLRPTNHQVSQRILIQQNNRQTLRHQDTTLSFSQSQKPFIQNTIAQPFSHDNNVDVFSNVINSFINNQGHKKMQSSARPFTSTSNSISNIQKPGSVQGNNQGKEICTFVQNSNGQGGKKVCQFVNGITGQQPLNSLEIPGQIGQNSPEIIPGGQIPSPSFEIFNGRGFESYGIRFGRSLGFKQPPEPGLLTHHVTVFPNGEVVAHKQPLSRHRRENEEINITKNTIVEVNDSETLNKVLSRRKRNLLPYASPSNVFETRLLSCRPGAARDINGKCRNKILPARIPQRRGTRAAPPVPPTPSCPGGMAFNIRRMCVPATTAQNSLVAFNLG